MQSTPITSPTPEACTASAHPTASLPRSLLISRQYALLWSGQAISGLGDAIFQTTVVLWIATSIGRGLSWAPLAVSGVFLAGEIPQFAIGPLAGVFVDRWEKRRTMLRADAARAVLLALLILAAGKLAVPWLLPYALPAGAMLAAIYGTVVLLTAANQFFLPARVVVIGDIVPDADREKAAGLAQSSGAVAGILGPALAAPLFFAAGVGWALAVNGLSFLASFTCIRLARLRSSPPSLEPTVRRRAGQVIEELLAGARLLAATRPLRVLVVTGALICLGLGALETLGIFFLQDNLHTRASLFGLMGGALGTGTLLGAIVGWPLAARAGVARTLWWMSIVLGALFLVFSRLTGFAPALAVMFLIGATFAVLEVSETPLLLRATPREYLGRVSALLVPAYGLSTAVSAVLAGWLAGHALHGLHASLLGISIGPIDTILAGGGLLVIAGGVYAAICLRDSLTPS